MKLRFAPTPNGLLHVGQARIALVNWLVARRNGGQFLLRLDDADTERCRPEHADSIQHDLRWLGLDWDACIAQSTRRDVYAEAAARLEAAGRLYPCFEGEDELTFKREQRLKQGKSPIYDRAMLKMTPAQRAQAEAGGKRPYFRFKLSGVQADWGDMVLGRQQVKLSAVSDPVVIRADGTPLHSFASAVDDLELGVTHVIRDAGHLTNTGIQLDILAALGARPNSIRFGHLPALEEPAGPKRPALPSLRSLRTDGIEPAALAGILASLGTPDQAQATSTAQLAEGYDLTRIGKDAPRFDPAQLLIVNRAALGTMPFEAAQDRLPPGATPAFWNAVRGSLDLMREARGWWDVVAGTIIPPLLEGEADFLHQALHLLPPEPWDPMTWSAWTGALASAAGRSNRGMEEPLRLALTGEDRGPDLADLLPLMGRTRVAERLRLAAT
jgi:glutamyl-tRNA synthetase